MKRIPCSLALLLASLTVSPATGFSQEGELPVLRRSFSEIETALPPFANDVFQPRQGETISFLGGTEVVDLDRHGFLEAGFHLAWPGLELRWRNLAWQGDTVYHQARPMYFYTKKGDTQPGSIPDHRERTEPGIVFIAFGKMESLEGADRIPAFIAAYAKLLDELAQLTKRIVLVEPTPFFHSGPAADLSRERNTILAAYIEAIVEVARDRGLRFVRFPLVEWNAGMSDNGTHLNTAGHRVFAVELLKGLGKQIRWEDPPPALRDAIARKNLLWQQYYRPSNWAFLFGDRQHVPASRDVEKREERWFVREIDALPALIAEAEKDIWRYAKEVAK